MRRRPGIVRPAVLARLAAIWRGGRLDLVLPDGACVRLGDSGAPDARAVVHADRTFTRLLLRGEMGAGEAFVAGEWSSDDLVGVLRLFLRATGARGFESPLTRIALWPDRIRHRRAANTPAGSARNIHAHYDLGNQLYRAFLDDATLAYSCAYWPDATMSLADAQRAKLERLCDWLALGPRDHLLELGCGWGGMALHAAATRGCRVTAITISREQHALASRRIADAGLSDRVSIQLRDYRTLGSERFDKLVSIEMLEAIGYDFLPDYFATCARVLRPGGRLALQSITMPEARFERYRRGVDWMQAYVFPGSLIPSLPVIERAAGRAGFSLERVDDIGPYYVPTLQAWRARFLDGLAGGALRLDERFVRTWLLYFAFSEAAFAERTLADHQLLLAR